MTFPTAGVWSSELAYHPDEGRIAEAAAELESLGFGVLWFPGGKGGEEFTQAQRLLAATTTALVASGILNVWSWTPAEAARGAATLRTQHEDRFLMGIGISHAPMIEGYKQPLKTMRRFIDGLDEAPDRLPREAVVVAALGPKMLDLSGERTAGTHPYFSPVEHTAAARERLGDGALVAPEFAAVLETDVTRARELARGHMEMYLKLPNYTNNLLRHGFEEADLADGGSDRLVDAIVAHGDVDAIAARAAEHHAAGADHVCVQVIHDGDGLPLEIWRELAPALTAV